MKLCECGTPIADDSRRCSSCHCRALNQDRARQRAKGKKAGQILADHNRSKASGTGYVKEPDGTDRHQHRVVAERILGRALLPEEVVHHEDRNKQNNNPINLIVFSCQAEHARHHKLGHDATVRCSCVGIRLGEVMPNAAP